MGSVRRLWRWVTANIIDLWKGAAITSAMVPFVLVLPASDQGFGSAPGWLLVTAAVATLPVSVYCWRHFALSPDPPFGWLDGPVVKARWPLCCWRMGLVKGPVQPKQKDIR